jgi:hypothetical protein
LGLACASSTNSQNASFNFDQGFTAIFDLLNYRLVEQAKKQDSHTAKKFYIVFIVNLLGLLLCQPPHHL